MSNAALGLPTTSKAWTKTWTSLLAFQPALYIVIVLLTLFSSYIYKLRKETIFACQAGLYSSDRYIASCNGTRYADYEHGAFAFGLEPGAEESARNADALFLGNSRLQFGFSTSATSNWFSAASARYYLLGFTYFENMLFAEQLLKKMSPKAKVYIINVDDFFDRSETPPVKTILHDPTAQARYESKRLWQRVHDPLCKNLPFLCMHQFAIFRSRETGAYFGEGMGQIQKITPVTYDDAINQNVVDRNTAIAKDFLKQFAQGKCVILTLVPYPGAKIGEADAIAKGVGMKFVSPGKLDGLQTWDGYHLDRPSAERWSQAFFQAAGPEIEACLGERRPSRQ